MRTRCLAAVLATGGVFLPAMPTWSQEQSETKTVSAAPNNNAAESNPAESKPKAKIFVPTDRYVPPDDSARTGFSGHIADFVDDQKQIWTSPARIRLSDANWLVPLSGITAGLFVTDRQYSASINQNPTTLKHYKSVSNYGIAGLIGSGAGLYLLSFPTHNERWRETGFLAGEAALNSLVTVEAFKYSLRRERPYQGNGSGAFFHGARRSPPNMQLPRGRLRACSLMSIPEPFPRFSLTGQLQQ